MITVTLVACGLVAIAVATEVTEAIGSVLTQGEWTPAPVHDPALPFGSSGPGVQSTDTPSVPDASDARLSDSIGEALEAYQRRLFDTGIGQLATEMLLADFQGCLDGELWIGIPPDVALESCQMLVARGEFEMDAVVRELAIPGTVENLAVIWIEPGGGTVSGVLRYELTADLGSYHEYMTGDRNAAFDGCLLTRRFGG